MKKIIIIIAIFILTTSGGMNSTRRPVIYKPELEELISNSVNSELSKMDDDLNILMDKLQSLKLNKNKNHE